MDEPSASTSPAFTLSPSFTIGRWWMSVPWFDRMNFTRSYESRSPLARRDDDALGVDVVTVPARLVRTTSPVSMAARYSRPVPMSGGSVMRSGTAWRCMFEPMSARFASLCSRNGISAVATETICAGSTSM